MPLHDWNRSPTGLYHHFHQSWTCELCNGLNAGVLPPGFFALVDQRAVGLIPDVARQSDREAYAAHANRVAVRNPFGEVVTIIELVSPGNKDGKHAFRAFVDKAVGFIANRVNMLVIDLFPPTTRDPHGIHKAIWDEIREEPFELLADKPLTLAAYSATMPITASVESVAVGDPLPAMPVFLEPGRYVPAPLEETYQHTWEKCPAELKEQVGVGGDQPTGAGPAS